MGIYTPAPATTDHLIRALHSLPQGSRSLGPWTSTSLWPVRNQPHSRRSAAAKTLPSNYYLLYNKPPVRGKLDFPETDPGATKAGGGRRCLTHPPAAPPQPPPPPLTAGRRCLLSRGNVTAHLMDRIQSSPPNRQPSNHTPNPTTSCASKGPL